MPKFNVSVPHGLPRDQAVDRLKGFSEKVREDTPVELTDVEENWDNDGNLNFSFKAMGMKISGSVVTSDSEVAVNGDLPFAAAMFRGAIENQIKEKIVEAIA
jgi:hypothetical protein